MAWSTTGRNLRAEAVADLVTDVSLHTGDPGASGASNEWSGGGYSRQTPSFGSASSGTVDLSTPLEFSGNAETTMAFVGFWATSTFLGGFARTGGDSAANSEGEYVITTLAITAVA